MCQKIPPLTHVPTTRLEFFELTSEPYVIERFVTTIIDAEFNAEKELPSAVNAGYFPWGEISGKPDYRFDFINLDQFAASGNKRDINRSSGSCARALERHDPFLGGGAVAYVWGSH
eukprot:sb/3476586/